MFVLSVVKNENGTTQLTVVPHICKFCKKAFLRQAALVEHLQCHVIKKESDINSDDSPGKDELPDLKIDVSDATDDALNSAKNDNADEIVCKGPLEADDKSSKFFCNLCNRSFVNKSYYNKHRQLHDGRKTYTCGICDKSFTLKDSLLKHCKIHDPLKQRFFCPECHKGFTSKQYLQKHELIHRGERPHVCNICGKAFTLKTNLNKHHASLHSEEKLFYMCELCNRGFSSKAYLEKHHLIHVGERPHVCGVCFKAFTLKTNLHKHYLTHTGYRRFGCDICYKRFKTKGALEQHYFVHSGARPFSCQSCPRTFKQKTHLLKHAQTHLGLELDDNICDKNSPKSDHFDPNDENWSEKMYEVKTIIN